MSGNTVCIYWNLKAKINHYSIWKSMIRKCWLWSRDLKQTIQLYNIGKIYTFKCCKFGLIWTAFFSSIAQIFYVEYNYICERI